LNYVDGGIVANNPSQVAIDEAKRIWGEDVPIKYLVSLGTGNSPQYSVHQGLDIVQRATDTEDTHKLVKSQLIGRYFRFNPPIPYTSFTESDNVILAKLKRCVRRYLEDSDVSLLGNILTKSTWVVPPKTNSADVLATYNLWKNFDQNITIRGAKKVFFSFWYFGSAFLDQPEVWKNYFEKGMEVTVVLPTPEALESVWDSIEFGDECRKQKFTGKKVTKSIEYLKQALKDANAPPENLKIYLLDHPQHYSIYMVDDEVAYMSIFEEKWSDDISSPVTAYIIKKKGPTRTFFSQRERIFNIKGYFTEYK